MSSSSLYIKQKKILSFVKNYINKNKVKINTANSAICYFHNYGDLPSSSILKLRFYGVRYFARFIINFLKSFILAYKAENYICVKNKSSIKYKSLLISHVSKNDFIKDGSYLDKYFQIRSNDYKKTLFFLNSIDGYHPKKLKTIL